MKKVSLAAIIATVSISLVGCTNSSLVSTNNNASSINSSVDSSVDSKTNNKITIDQAKEIALQHAGLTKDQVEFFESENDIDDGVEKYNIEFNCNGKEYDYEISATDGSIIQCDNDVDDDISENNTHNITQNTDVQSATSNTTSNTASNVIKKTTTQNDSTNNVQNNTASNTSSISLDKAKEIALSHAGLSSNQVTFVQAKKDFDDGIEKYEIEFYYNGKEYDYEINAANGQIIKYDYDMEYNYTPNNNQSNSQSNNQSNSNTAAKISAERAKEIALSHAGLSSNQVTFKKVELDFDDGIQKYDVEFYYNYREYSYEINASNGSIISYERD